MATFTNFSSLTTKIQNAIQRGGSNASDQVIFNQIPDFINSAERKLAILLKIQGMVTPITGAFQPGLPVYPKPDRWRETISLNFGTGTGNNKRTPLYARGYEWCRTFWPDDTQTEEPQFYADYDLQHWLIVPTPDQAYPFEVVSYLLPALLDSTNQTNFWTDFLPNLLFYGSLLEAIPFLGDNEDIPMWESKYQVEIVAADGQDLQKVLDRASKRQRA